MTAHPTPDPPADHAAFLADLTRERFAQPVREWRPSAWERREAAALRLIADNTQQETA